MALTGGDSLRAAAERELARLDAEEPARETMTGECSRERLDRYWLASAAMATHWQPIASAPRDGTEVLALFPERRRMVAQFHGGEWVVWAGIAGERSLGKPTHWLAMPEAPESEAP